MLSRNVALVGAISVVILWAFAAAVANAIPPDPHKIVMLDPSDALAAVEPFFGDENAKVTGPFEQRYWSSYAVAADGFSANVDAHDGTVRTLTIESAFPTSPKILLAPEKARELGAAFLGAPELVKPTTEGHVSVLDHGGVQEYLVEWQSVVNGALAPDYRAVSLNPETGAVFSYVNGSRDYAVPPDPKVDEPTAIATATKLTDPEGALKIRTVELRIDFDEGGDQTLVWSIILTGNASLYDVEVDAISGLAQIVGRG